jgi:DUF1009 family protein
MQVFVEKDWTSRATRFYIQVEKGNERFIIGQKDGLLIEQHIDPINATAEPIIPLLEMSDRMADDFIKAIVDYASQKGVKTENENLLMGKLSATEKHLEDMRKHFEKVLDKVVSQ